MNLKGHRTHFPTAEDVFYGRVQEAEPSGAICDLENIYRKALDETPVIFPPQINERLPQGIKIEP